MPWDPNTLALFAIATDGEIDQILLKGLASVGAISLGSFIVYKLRHAIDENAQGIANGGKSLITYWYDCRELIITRRAKIKKLKRDLAVELERVPRPNGQPEPVGIEAPK